MKTKLKLLSLTWLSTTLLNATTIIGVGYGINENDSLKESLADLSNKVSVTVKSEFKTITKAMGKEYNKDNIKTTTLSSNLPIKGARYKKLDGDRLTKTTAILDSKNSLKAYMMELKRLKKNIAYSLLTLETTKDETKKYDILLMLLNDIENFNKHKIVATLLEGNNLPSIDITISQVKSQIKTMEQTAPTIQIASKILTKDINQKHIYISAIKPHGSNEITQFAKILKDSMSENLDTEKYSNNAKYFLRGDYEILKNSIFITINLSDTNNNILKTTTITLAKSAYKNTKYKPKTKTFDESINSGFLKSGKLFVNIGFKGYNRDDGIDLNSGDLVDVVVKTNKPICYFLIGHTLKDNEKFSYVLPIGSDNSPYINNITGEDVNKNITIIDDIPVSAPFGSETLQIFSSTFTKNGKCPLKVPKCIENNDGYCVINAKPSNVVKTTRGLNMSKRKQKIEKAESSVSWTSFK